MTTSADILRQAFHDHDGPYDLYRSTYKDIDCGPTIGFLVVFTEYNDNGEGGPHNPGDVEKEKWFYGDDLKKLGLRWESLWDCKVLNISVSSIVEGAKPDPTAGVTTSR